MYNPARGRILALLLGSTLLAAACGEEGADTDSPYNPVVGFDSGVPPVGSPMGGGLPVGTGTTGGPAATGGPGTVGGGMGGVPGGGGIAGREAGVGNTPRGDAAVSGPSGSDAGVSDAAAPPSTGGGQVGADAGPGAGGMCCDDGNCLCHGPNPTALTANRGPYKTESYTISGTGCVYYPTDAEPPYAAVTVSDGFIGSGGCGSFQTGQWGPLYASWGIVAMIVDTGSLDQPSARGQALSKGIAAFKAEDSKSGSPLFGKLAGRYGTSGFSMGGGGTTYAARDDKTLLTNIAIMPWGPVNSGVTVPTLVVCGASDSTAPCSSHGTPAYRGIADSVPKMRVQVSGGHNGQPSAGGGRSGQYGLAFQKVFLEGDQRWRPLLVAAESAETNIK